MKEGGNGIFPPVRLSPLFSERDMAANSSDPFWTRTDFLHSGNDAESSPFSHPAKQYVNTITIVISCTIFCLFAIASNIINVVTFILLKSTDPLKAAFLGLAIADLGTVVSLMCLCITFLSSSLWHGKNSDLVVLDFESHGKVGALTYAVFAHVSAFITIYITLLYCVTYPRKVKRKFTMKRVSAIIVALYVTIITSTIIKKPTVLVAWTFVENFNKTRTAFSIKLLDQHSCILQTTVYYIKFFHPVITFVLALICFIVLLWKLSKGSERGHRRKKDFLSSSQERQNGKTIVSLAAMFIVSSIPRVTLTLLRFLESRGDIDKVCGNIFDLLSSLIYLFSAFTASVKIFIYYNLSPRYASTYQSLFWGRRAKSLV